MLSTLSKVVVSLLLFSLPVFADGISGLTYQTYRGTGATPNYTTLYYSTVLSTGTSSTINFDWGGSNVLNSGRSEQVIVKWTGYINVPESGSYTFGGYADDGVIIKVNNNTVVNSWIESGAALRYGTATLTAGVQPIEVWYYENGGAATMALYWYKPSLHQGWTIVPSSVLATSNTYWAPQSVITNNQQTIVNTSKAVSGSGIYVNQSGTGVNLNITQQGPNNLIKGQDLSSAAQIIGDYNSLTVNQNTSGNVLGIDVNGSNNTIDILQNKNQTAVIGITGNTNSLTLEQQIFGLSGEHFAKINISGNSNTIDTSQKDSGNKILFTDIQGSNNAVDVKQWGTGQHFLDLTLGNSNTVNVIQDGSGSHNATINLSGNPTTLNLTQDASTNKNYYLQQLCTTATCSATVTQQ
jgi:hypothetical protein